MIQLDRNELSEYRVAVADRCCESGCINERRVRSAWIPPDSRSTLRVNTPCTVEHHIGTSLLSCRTTLYLFPPVTSRLLALNFAATTLSVQGRRVASTRVLKA